MSIFTKQSKISMMKRLILRIETQKCQDFIYYLTEPFELKKLLQINFRTMYRLMTFDTINIIETMGSQNLEFQTQVQMQVQFSCLLLKDRFQQLIL